MILWERKTIFVHIYKTAGTSISSRLKQSSPGHRLQSASHRFAQMAGVLPVISANFAAKIGSSRPQLWKHAGIKEYKIFLGDRFPEFFSFAFVRNPYSWQVSIYEYIRSSPGHPLHSFCKSVSFCEYLRSGVPESVRPQADFISSTDYKCSVDFVGKYESINEHWPLVASRVGCDPSPLSRLNVAASRRPLLFYYDKEAVKIVSSRFAVDMDMFGYSSSFDDAASDS